MSAGQNAVDSVAPKVDQEAQLRALAEGLGSEDFEARDRAMEDLWMKADAALPYLQKMLESDDPEMQARARELRRQILSGILPDTPPEIAALLEKFNKAKGRQRLSVINELYRAKAYDYLFRLMRIEEDADLLAQMKKNMERFLPTIVRASLIEGKWDDARRYLEQWHSPGNDRNLAALLQTRGLLDAELKRLSESQKPEDRARYLAFLQFVGDPQAVFDEAVAQNNAGVRDMAGILLGKPEFALRSSLVDLNVNQRRYLQIVLARLEGDDKKVEDLRAELLASAAGGGELLNQARSVFYHLGDLSEVENLMQDDEEAQETFYFAMEKPLLGLEAAGIKDGKLDAAWLLKQCNQMVDGVMENEEETDNVKLKILAAFFENHGDLESSSAIVEAYARAFMGEDQEDYLAAYVSDFLIYAPRSFCLAIDKLYAGKKVKEGQRILLMIFNNYREESEVLAWTYQKVQLLRPKLSMGEQARMTLSCATDSCYVDLAERAQLLAEMEEKALVDLKNGMVEEMQNLMRLAILRNDSESLVRIGTQLKEAGENNWGYALTLNHAYWGRWKEAEKTWADYLKTEAQYENVPPFLYLSGLLMEKAGQKEAAEKKMAQARLLGMDENEYRASVLSYLSNFAEPDVQYAYLKRQFLSQADENVSNLALLFQEATKNHDWPVAEASGEVLLSRMGLESNEVEVLQIRYGTDMARGFRLYAEGKIAEAEKTLEAAHDLRPGSGLHADELFPQLREIGLLSLHDRLFEKTYQRVMDVLKVYPDSENDKNTAAWLASRALLKLDEAEKMMNEVLQNSPVNSAYLDTMAELQFAKGNRAKALEWSRKSLLNEVSDRTLRGQYERYKNAPLPSRDPKKGQ